MKTKKERRAYFDCFWQWKHWYLLPAISLHNYENAYDILLQFMGLFIQVTFAKK